MSLNLKLIQKDWITFLTAALLIGIFCTAILAPLISPYDPAHAELSKRLLPPFSEGHLIGTDQLGRDLLSRVIYGARISISVGLTAVLIAGSFGTVMGLLSGFYGGWTDRIIMRFVDMQLSFPFVVLALTIAAILGPSFKNIIFTLAISSWVVYARLVRGETLNLKHRQFINACKTLGLPAWRIIFIHILPNIAQSIVVLATLEVGRLVIGEAAISFLGYGIQPPTPSWGSMLSEGRDYMMSAWWLTVFPGLGIVMMTLAVNIVGDSLRSISDPKLRTD